MAVKFQTKDHEGFVLVEFELDPPVITPEELKAITPPAVPVGKGVIISGRGPIWLYGAVIHRFHPASWVGVFDLRLGGGVVVESHVPDVNVGDVIEL